MDRRTSATEARLAYTSKDGEEGFPGILRATVMYSWRATARDGGDMHELRITWSATTDVTTVVNLTNHSYFNLEGVKQASDILTSHTVMLNCDSWTEVDGD